MKMTESMTIVALQGAGGTEAQQTANSDTVCRQSL